MADDNEIRRHAKEVAQDMMENLAVGHRDEITVPWLMEMHPELDAEEAEEYRMFCKRNTIVYRGCYGEGQKMWPLWQAFKEEIAGL